MGLFAIHVLHFRALCDGCRRATSDVFCGGDMGQAGRYEAIEALRRVGWRHRRRPAAPPGSAASTDPRDPDWVEREGAGEWLCAACVRRAGPGAARHD